jgi:hypothetical protein
MRHLLNPKVYLWYHSSNAMGREVSLSLRSPLDDYHILIINYSLAGRAPSKDYGEFNLQVHHLMLSGRLPEEIGSIGIFSVYD